MIHSLLGPELKTAKQCWLEYPESASLNVAEVNWFAEKKYWDTVRNNWQRNAFVGKQIDPPQPGIDAWEIEGQIYDDQLFSCYFKNNRRYVEVWDLRCRPDPLIVFEGASYSFGVSASYLISIGTFDSDVVQIYNRNDFTKVRSVRFRSKLTNPSVAKVDDHFAIVSGGGSISRLHIFDIENGTWGSVKSKTGVFTYFPDKNTVITSPQEDGIMYKYDGYKWNFGEHVPRPEPFYDSPVRVTAHCRIISNPDVYMYHAAGNENLVRVTGIKSGNWRKLYMSEDEKFEEAVSHVYVTQGKSDPCLFSVYQVPTRTKFYTVKLKREPLLVLMSEKYLVFQYPEGLYEIRDYSLGHRQPHLYLADHLFGHLGPPMF